MIRKTRPGIDRITMQEARSAVKQGKADIREHLANCGQCALAEDEAYVHCRAWWRIMMPLHRAERRLMAMEQTHDPNQMELPLMTGGEDDYHYPPI